MKYDVHFINNQVAEIKKIRDITNALYEEFPLDWGGNYGDKRNWFDKNKKRIPNDELIKKGLRTDYRGVWYNKNDPLDVKHITHIDVIMDSEWTKESPLQDEEVRYQKFDEASGKFVVDETLKQKTLDTERITEIDAELAEINQKQIRPASEIAASLGNGNTPPEAALTKIAELNAQADGLRNERTEIVARLANVE